MEITGLDRNRHQAGRRQSREIKVMGGRMTKRWNDVCIDLERLFVTNSSKVLVSQDSTPQKGLSGVNSAWHNSVYP